MQVSSLCLFVCLPDCWSAHQRTHQREKTQGDKIQREKKQNTIKRDFNFTFIWHFSRQASYTTGFSCSTGKTSQEYLCNY